MEIARLHLMFVFNFFFNFLFFYFYLTNTFIFVFSLPLPLPLLLCKYIRFGLFQECHNINQMMLLFYLMVFVVHLALFLPII